MELRGLCVQLIISPDLVLVGNYILNATCEFYAFRGD